MKAFKLFMLSVFTTSLLATFNVNAQSIEQAAELYAKRGQDTSFAKQAAEMYLTLSSTSANKLEKVELLREASRSLYYVGTHSDSDSAKKQFHNEAMDAALNAQALVNEPADDQEKLELAKALFWYGANLGKWAEANGVASSLGRWPTLKSTMNRIISLGHKKVENYGANRILGRAYYKLPFPLGSKKKAFAYLSEAVKNTKNGNKVSVSGLNNLFLADVLISIGKKDSAKGLLQAFVEADAQTLDPERVPENLEEQQEAREKLQRL